MREVNDVLYVHLYLSIVYMLMFPGHMFTPYSCLQTCSFQQKCDERVVQSGASFTISLSLSLSLFISYLHRSAWKHRVFFDFICLGIYNSHFSQRNQLALERILCVIIPSHRTTNGPQFLDLALMKMSEAHVWDLNIRQLLRT
jgi:hypothetical protein